MKIYTANQLQAIVNAAYMRGYDDGKLNNYAASPPSILEITDHPLGPEPRPVRETEAERVRRLDSLKRALVAAITGP